MKKPREEAQDEDYFGRLPGDVIFDIFGQVNDSKLLTQCLLLSKRIASLIRLLTSISIKIHPSPVKRHGHFFVRYTLVCFRDKLISSPSRDDEIEYQCTWRLFIDELPPFCISKAVEGLHPFSKVKSAIIVEYSEFGIIFPDMKTRWIGGISPDIKTRWMVEYSGGDVSTGIIKSCSFLAQINHFKGINSLKYMILTWVASSFQSAFTLHPMVAQMVQNHESLRDILVTSASPREGWIHAGEDEIVKMRQVGGLSADKLIMIKMFKMMEEIHMKVKVWYDVTAVPDRPGESTVYAFVVISSPDNIDHEVKAAARRFLGDCSYWARHDNEVIQQGINMKELVETMPCRFEGTVCKERYYHFTPNSA